MKMNLSETAIRALKIVKDNSPITPSRFSVLMWPDNPNHNKVSNIGRNGATKGVGMWFAGGGYLAKLRRKGLVTECVRFYGDKYVYAGYQLTNLGEKQLDQ